MSGLKGKVGPWELNWVSIPRGPSGSAYVQTAEGRQMEVHWRKDPDGLWIELPDGVYGFDIQGERNDEGGVNYQLSQRNSDCNWSNLAFLRSGEEFTVASMASKKKGVRVRAQMPGKIVRILVDIGSEVVKGQSLVVMEAMKMENEIRALHPGKVSAIKISEGQNVETGADLLVLEQSES
jgi:biotin carboxyl carrier protein